MYSSGGLNEAIPRHDQANHQYYTLKAIFQKLLENHGKPNNLLALAVLLLATDSKLSPRNSATRVATAST